MRTTANEPAAVSAYFDDWSGVVTAVFVGALAYVALLVILRLSGKRTLAKMNAFDLVVTVALGSTLATIILSRDVALAEGVAALALLCGAQYAVAQLSTSFGWARRLVRAEPTVVLRDGELLHSALASVRLTAGEVEQAVRASGCGGLDQVAAVVLETDGSLSVITVAQAGSRSVLDGLQPERHDRRSGVDGSSPRS